MNQRNKRDIVRSISPKEYQRLHSNEFIPDQATRLDGRLFENAQQAAQQIAALDRWMYAFFVGAGSEDDYAPDYDLPWGDYPPVEFPF